MTDEIAILGFHKERVTESGVQGKDAGDKRELKSNDHADRHPPLIKAGDGTWREFP
jgi:hypothetical protein